MKTVIKGLPKNVPPGTYHGTVTKVTHNKVIFEVTKSTRATREELRAMVKKLRDAAMDVPNLDSGHPWSETLEGLIIEADLVLARGASGGYVKKTECDHARIKALAPVFWARMQAGDRVLTIAREHGVNRTTVRKWAAYHQKHRDELCACARVVLGPECEGQTTA